MWLAVNLLVYIWLGRGELRHGAFTFGELPQRFWTGVNVEADLVVIIRQVSSSASFDAHPAGK